VTNNSRGAATRLSSHGVSAARVVVYDPDGVNPYGRELAAQLAAAGCEVTAVVAADVEWRPPGVRTMAVLPYNRAGAGSVARQAFRLLRGLLTVAWCARDKHAQWVVVWTRTRYDEALVAFVARRRRVHVVVHNPGARDTGGRALRAAATTNVVHSAALAEGMPRAAVCAHPLYVHWLAYARPSTAPGRGDAFRLLLLGHRRADKGDDLLPAVFAALPDDVRVEVVACGKGAPPLGLGVRVEDRTSRDFVPDRDLAATLLSCDALLAPYTGATQSGTVALAVTAGLPVLGFASGAIAELAGDAGLVPNGDTAALAARIAAAAHGDLPRPAPDAGHAVRDWLRVFG
jgi:glycosyltransferase involved in cell wall biosynthesis